MASNRRTSRVVVIGGLPHHVTSVENPVIDDLLVAEAKVQALHISGVTKISPSHRVDRRLRDFLIRLGVEQ